MIKIWHDTAWEDYLYWQTQDRKTLKRINKLLQDLERNGYMESNGDKLSPVENEIVQHRVAQVAP